MARNRLIIGLRYAPVLAAALLLGCLPWPEAAQAQDEVTPEVQRLYAEAKAAQKQDDLQTAVAKYEEMIKLAPHLAAAYNNLGMLYFNAHDYQHATKILERGLAVNPAMPSASAMLGMSYFQLGENTKAETALRAALRANPKDDQVEMTLCRVLINERKLEDATAHLNSL